MSSQLKSAEQESDVEHGSSGFSLPRREESAALARMPSEAERRVQRAKDRLQHHLAMLDQRARSFAKQTAWIAGMVLLGFVGAAVAASVFRPKPRRGMYYADESRRGRGVGPALMLAAFGVLSRGARSIARNAHGSYEV